ncbi:MAG: hypothetical protein ACQGVC_07130 [Myxococcota bacterium]
MRRLVLTAVLLFVTPQLMGAPGCNGPPSPTPLLRIDSPATGTFTNASSIVVSGYARRGGGQIASLTVNGIDALPLTGTADEGTWSVSVPLDPNLIFNDVVAEMTLTGFHMPVITTRIAVVAGDGVNTGYVLDGSKSPESIALRLNDSGLDEVEPVITSLVTLDLPTLLPVGTQVINEYCYSSIFGLCIGSADAYIEANASPPSPSISGFSIDVDSQTNHADGLITLNDLFVRARVEDGDHGIGFTCHVNISANVSNIDGNYGLDPDAVDPSLIDVSQQGGVSVSFGSFSDSTDCDGFLGFVVEAFVNLFVGSFEGLMRDALEDFLDTPDVNGNTPVAGAIEVALEDVDIAGPIGDALGAVLDTALFTVDEDVDGITLGSDGSFVANPVASGTCWDDLTDTELPGPVFCDADTPCGVDESCRGLPGECVAPANAPDYPASYHVTESFPSFGATTPGALPYGMGLGVSTSAFNQLLKAQLECGLLTLDVRDLPGLGPLSGSLLVALIPEIAQYPLATPYKLLVDPQIGAIVTGNMGPGGELAELRIHGLQVTLRDVDEELPVLLVASVNASLGLDASFSGGALSFTLGAPDPVNGLEVAITTNRLGTDEASLTSLIEGLFVLALPELSNALEAFPLPDFLGLSLSDVEVGRAGEFLSLYLDLSPSP